MPTLLTAGDSVSAASSLAAGNDGLLNIIVGPSTGKLTAVAIDAAGNMNALGGHRIINRGNILGVVSQAAGVPTGAVIERGSNANGEFVRFADGTQICTSVQPTTGLLGINSISSNIAFALPAVFIDNTFSVSVVAVPGSHPDCFGVLFCHPTSTGAGIFVLRNGATIAQAYAPRVIAIGRWF